MKINNKGFAISTIMYLILAMGILLIISTLAILSTRKVMLDRQKNDVLNSIMGYEENDNICIPVTEDNKTTGNIPQKDENDKIIYSIGDEYICEVKKGVKYHFFIVSYDDKSINLLMDRNINSTGGYATSNDLVEWISQDDYDDDTNYGAEGNNDKGPITVINYLDEATSTWSNIKNLNYKYIDEGNNYSEISITGKARLITLEEIENTSCDLSNETSGSCPLWMVNYLEESDEYTNADVISNINGYWTFSSDQTTSALSIYKDGYIKSNSVNSDEYGVRPVINVLKTKVKDDSDIDVGTNTSLYLYLLGNNPYIIKNNKVFIEPGYWVIPANGDTTTNNDDVVVTGKSAIAYYTPGTYPLTYSITDIYNTTISKTRNVIIPNPPQFTVAPQPVSIETADGKCPNIFLDPDAYNDFVIDSDYQSEFTYINYEFTVDEHADKNSTIVKICDYGGTCYAKNSYINFPETLIYTLIDEFGYTDSSEVTISCIANDDVPYYCDEDNNCGMDVCLEDGTCSDEYYCANFGIKCPDGELTCGEYLDRNEYNLETFCDYNGNADYRVEYDVCTCGDNKYCIVYNDHIIDDVAYLTVEEIKKEAYRVCEVFDGSSH